MALPIPMVFPATATIDAAALFVVVVVGHSDQIVHQGKLMLPLVLLLLMLLLLLPAVLSFSFSSALVIVFTSAAAATSVCGGLVRIFQVSASGSGRGRRGRRCRGPLLVAVLRAGRLAVRRVHLMLRARRVRRRRVVLRRHRAPRRRREPRHVVGERLLRLLCVMLMLLLRGRSAVDLIRRGGLVRGTRLARTGVRGSRGKLWGGQRGGLFLGLCGARGRRRRRRRRLRILLFPVKSAPQLLRLTSMIDDGGADAARIVKSLALSRRR